MIQSITSSLSALHAKDHKSIHDHDPVRQVDNEHDNLLILTPSTSRFQLYSNTLDVDYSL